LVVPSIRSLDLSIGTQRLCLVLHDENIVLILVRVEGDLLLLATGGIHVVVRVQIATLGVVVTKADTRAKGNIGRDVLHTLGVQSRLELGGHETITLTGVDQACEVDGEHGKVESKRNHNQTEDTSEKVLEPQSRGNRASIPKQDPKLESRERADPSHCEETNPLDTEGGP
jgi:hypothetical protein